MEDNSSIDNTWGALTTKKEKKKKIRGQSLLRAMRAPDQNIADYP